MPFNCRGKRNKETKTQYLVFNQSQFSLYPQNNNCSYLFFHYSEQENKTKTKQKPKKMQKKRIIMLCGNITTSRWFKCVPTFHGSLSVHIFMLLFRFLWDFTWKCEIAKEIRMPFDDMCDNFLLVIVQKRTVASILKILPLIS